MNFSARILFLLVILTFGNLPTNVDSKAEYVQPLTCGLQVCVPYDIANVWNRPVATGPFISTFLGLSLLYILFFGVITSPFGYMFGVPSEKYVLGGDGSSSLFSAVLQASEQWHNYTDTSSGQTPDPGSDQDQQTQYNYNYNIPRSLTTPIIRKVIKYELTTPEFGEGMFRFIPEGVLEDVPCQQLVLCHAHSALRTLSGISLPTYRVFSKILRNVTEPHRTAIKAGLSNLDCDATFHSCPSNLISVLPQIFLGALPKWIRKSIILPQF